MRRRLRYDPPPIPPALCGLMWVIVACYVGYVRPSRTRPPSPAHSLEPAIACYSLPYTQRAGDAPSLYPTPSAPQHSTTAQQTLHSHISLTPAPAATPNHRKERLPRATLPRRPTPYPYPGPASPQHSITAPTRSALYPYPRYPSPSPRRPAIVG
jgi:hypothetical protein